MCDNWEPYEGWPEKSPVSKLDIILITAFVMACVLVGWAVL